ncbi:MAG: S1/P1 nuclease [Pseudohongiellaceae bacterium]
MNHIPVIRRLTRAALLPVFSAAILLSSASAIAWDATGHRVSAGLAWDRLSETQREQLLTLLSAHPRFDEDFRGAMPAPVRQASTAEQQRWLFGQAAVWPDVARGLPDSIVDRYNRPDWHWIDGALVRGQAQRQGNIYLGVARRPDITGADARAADNVLGALERAWRELQATDTPETERALALSWFLHLTADLHQPLHSGALFAPGPLQDGDRGGNSIRVAQGHEGNNLHALWDRALHSPEPEGRLQRLRRQRETMAPDIDTTWAPTRWLAESRDLLHEQVYPPALRTTIEQRISRDQNVPVFDPSVGYLTTMQRTARQQVIRAAERMAAALADLETGQGIPER